MSEIFFIRGHAKSGTNWLNRLVNLHPEINAKGEFHLENLFSGLISTFESPFGILKKNEDQLLDHFYTFVENLISHYCDSFPMCGDRTPGPITDSYIPGRKCLYISRDGRDVLVSWTYHAFRKRLHSNPIMLEKQIFFDSDPNYFELNKHQLLDDKEYVTGFASKWNNFILRDLENMARADLGHLNLPYFHIRYEDLHQNLDYFLRKIFNFLGVDSSAVAQIPANLQPGFDKINNMSLYRRGEAGAWKEYFNSEQENWFTEMASEAIEKLEN